MKRLLFLTSQNTPTAAAIIRELLTQCSDCTLDARFEMPRRTWKSRIKAQIKHLRKNGLLWIPYRVWAACRAVARESREMFFPTSKPRSLFDSEDDLRLRFGVRFSLDVKENFHAEDFLRQVAEAKYDLGIVFGTRILKQCLFALPAHGMINIHQGIIPDYRGMPPAFWELYNDAPETGVSIHEVSELLDGGDLLAQQRIPLDGKSTLSEVQTKLDNLAVSLIPQTVQSVLTNSVTRKKTSLELGKCYTQPTVNERFTFWWRTLLGRKRH